MHLSVVILAAGQGKRMNSDLPKVLQPPGGAAAAAACDRHGARSASDEYLRGLWARRRTGAGGPGARARRVDTAGGPTGHGPCRHASHVRHPRRSHGAGALRRRAADPRALPDETDGGGRRGRSGRAVRVSRQCHGLRAHRPRCRRAGQRHRRAKGREPRAAADTRSEFRAHGGSRAAPARMAAGTGQEQFPARVLPDRRGRRRRAGGRSRRSRMRRARLGSPGRQRQDPACASGGACTGANARRN